jgi:hypothetical protein
MSLCIQCQKRAVTQPKHQVCGRCYQRMIEHGTGDELETRESRNFEPTKAYRDLLSPETRASLEAWEKKHGGRG